MVPPPLFRAVSGHSLLYIVSVPGRCCQVFCTNRRNYDKCRPTVAGNRGTLPAGILTERGFTGTITMNSYDPESKGQPVDFPRTRRSEKPAAAKNPPQRRTRRNGGKTASAIFIKGERKGRTFKRNRMERNDRPGRKGAQSHSQQNERKTSYKEKRNPLKPDEPLIWKRGRSF